MKKFGLIIIAFGIIFLSSCSASIEEIKLSKDNVELSVGDEYKLSFTTNVENNDGFEFEWSSSNTQIATVNREGKITALSPGFAEIRLKSGDVEAFSSVKVLEVQAKSITISGNSKIEIGEVVQFTASFLPLNTTSKIVAWSTSDQSILEINESGGARGIKNGIVDVIVRTSNGIEARLSVSVFTGVESIQLSKPTIDMYVGDSSTISVTYIPTNAEMKSVTWSSSNSDIATVENGVIKAQKEGTSTITARSVNGKTATIFVNVKSKPISFSGSGKKVLSNINVPFGQYKVTLTHSGSSNFAVWFYEENDSYGDLLVNEIGRYSGTSILRDGSIIESKNATIEILASGSWTIKIEKVTGETTTNIKGTGDKVTGYFTGDGKRNVVTVTNSGSSNFIIILYNPLGYDVLLVNEIGKVNYDFTLLTVKDVKYFMEIKSSGTWTVNFNKGEEQTIVK